MLERSFANLMKLITRQLEDIIRRKEESLKKREEFLGFFCKRDAKKARLYERARLSRVKKKKTRWGNKYGI